METKESRHRGFTLIESLCVIVIVTIALGIPLYSTKRWQEQQAAQRTLLSFERLFAQTHQSSLLEEMYSSVFVDRKNQQITFNRPYHQQRDIEVLRIESPLSVTSSVEELRFTGKGSRPSSLAVYTFYNQQTNEKTIYKVQLGSGKVNKYVEKQ